eukprot:gene26407-17505_t
MCLYPARSSAPLSPHTTQPHRPYITITDPAFAPTTDISVTNLPALLTRIRPTAMVGASSVGGAFSQEALECMCKGVESRFGPKTRLVVMALSNPTEKAECTFAQ